MDICPVCKEDNQCGADAYGNAFHCWCFKKEIPKRLVEIVPGPGCICEKCVDKYNNAEMNDVDAFLKSVRRK